MESCGERCYRVDTGPEYDSSTLWWWVREEDCEPCEALEHIPTPYHGSHEHHVALNAEHQRKLKKGETKMKYKRLKTISLSLLWAAQPDRGCVDFLKEWAIFMNWFVLEAGESWPGQMKFSTPWAAMYDVFLQEMKEHAHSSVWLDFMEKHGFIEKEFEPFSVVIGINSEAEALRLSAKGRCGNPGSRNVNNGDPISVQIDAQLKAHGVKV